MASSDLLAQIQAGKRLKKATTNDRSAPPIAGTPIDPSKGSSGGRGAGSVPAPSKASDSGGGLGGPPQLAGLFAGGMPKLKSAGQNAAGMARLKLLVQTEESHPLSS